MMEPHISLGYSSGPIQADQQNVHQSKDGSVQYTSGLVVL